VGVRQVARRWSVRRYADGDEDGILDLARLIFVEQPSDRFTHEYWQWEFIENSAGPACMCVADDHGAIVGYYAAIPTKVKVASVVETGSIVVDVMSHPEYRFQGMFTALGKRSLAEAAASGIKFAYGFPVRPDVMPGHLKVGWKHAFDIPVLVRPLRAGRIVGRVVKPPVLAGLAGLLGSAAQLGYETVARPVMRALYKTPTPTARVVLRDLDTFDERFDDLWSRASTRFSVGVVRDREYLQWRYAHHPYHRYRVTAAEQDGQLVGYSVAREADLMGFPSGVLVDLLVDPRTPAAGHALVRSVTARFAENPHIELVASMMSRASPYFGLLQHHGYIRTPKVFWFIVHINRDDLDAQAVLDAGNWYLTWGDTDVL